MPADMLFELIGDEIDVRFETVFPHAKGEAEPEALPPFIAWMRLNFPIALTAEDFKGKHRDDAKQFVLERIRDIYKQREQFEEPAALRWLERYVMIRAIDRNWQDHLTEMEDLRNSVGLRGYGQKDPLNEYKMQAYVFFEELMGRVRNDICTGLFRSATNPEAFQNMVSLMSRVQHSGPATDGASAPQRKPEPKLPKIAPVKREAPQVGRNDPCPCGSGKKYKKCCGKDL